MASYTTPSLLRGIASSLDPKSSACLSSVHASHSSPIHLASCFSGSKLTTAVYLEPQRRAGFVTGRAYATAATAVVDTGVKLYTLPTWAAFEMGEHSVYWETGTGRPPASGELLTIYFNPAASDLVPNPDYGFAFNGGFNQPIMCGGEPRVMTRRDRGIKCTPFYIIKINVPLHALTLEFSFTNGSYWDGPYKLKFEIPAKWRRMPPTFFNEGLAKELSNDGACESAIYPDAAFVQDRCVFPAALIHEGGDRCELDIVPGCIDPESPFFDPLANRDDGSCPLVLGESSDSE